MKKNKTNWLKHSLGFTLLLSSCKFSSPMQGPIKNLKNLDQDRVFIVITNADLRSQSKKKFFKMTTQLHQSMDQFKGYLGHSIRRTILGYEVWTMTAWKSEQDANNFVYSKQHMQAIETSVKAVKTMRSYRAWFKKSELPISWKQADQLLSQKKKTKLSDYYQ